MNIAASQPSITLVFQSGMNAQQIAMTGQIAQEGRHLDLQVNQIIRATVTEGGLNNVELDLNRLRFRAFSKTPLTPGQRINLQVVKTHPQIELKILDEIDLQHLFRALNFFSEKKGFLSILSQFLHQSESSLQNISAQSRQTLNQLQENLFAQTDNIMGRTLAGMSRMLGFDLEALLAQGQSEEGAKTLKGVLLTLSQSFSEDSPEAKNIDNLLKTIEMWQLFQLRLADKGLFFLPLPLPFLEQGYLLAGKNKDDQHQQKGSDRDSFWISIHLRLSALGNIEAVLFSEDSGLNIRIMCQNSQVAQYMSQFKNDLQDNMNSQDIAKLIIDIGAKDPEKNLLAQLLPDNESFFEALV